MEKKHINRRMVELDHKEVTFDIFTSQKPSFIFLYEKKNTFEYFSFQESK
jgi:hypothetical protein